MHLSTRAPTLIHINRRVRPPLSCAEKIRYFNTATFENALMQFPVSRAISSGSPRPYVAWSQLCSALRTNATRRKLNSHEYGTNQTPISKGAIRLSWKPFSPMEPR